MTNPMRASPYRFSRGAELSHKTRTDIPADAKLRPLRDVIIVEPLDGNLSAIIEVIHECKPVRGIVRAVGPGCHKITYLDANGCRLPDYARKQRKQKAHGKSFIPTVVKVGDIVQLGGLDIGGYSFDSFYHGDRLMLMAREADVAGIEEDAPPSEAQLAALDEIARLGQEMQPEYYVSGIEGAGDGA